MKSLFCAFHPFSSVQSLSHVSLFSTPQTATRQASLSITNSWSFHVHWVSDAIQPCHPLLSPSPLSLSLFQHQVLFQWISSLNQVAKVLEFQLQHQSFQWTFRTDGVTMGALNPNDLNLKSVSSVYQLCDLVSYSTSVCLSFLIWNMKIITTLIGSTSVCLSFLIWNMKIITTLIGLLWN